MTPPTFTLGTRKSPLALWQAHRVRALLQESRPEVQIEIVQITTTGDRVLDKPLVQVGEKGIFTKEIENALLAGEIDFAVHSYKDLPTVLPEGLAVLCIPERDSPYDALVSRGGASLSALPPKPLIATGSLRRRAQVLIARPDAQVVDVRGNVNTRMKKFEDAAWNAMILAHAGIRRMEWDVKIAGILSIDEMLPAPAQGALAVEARRDDEAARQLLGTIHNESTARLVRAERAFLAELEGGCQVPIAAHAMESDQGVTLYGLIANLDGSRCLRQSLTLNAQPEILAKQLAEQMLQSGGGEIIAQLKAAN